jgi:hypothetical protein
MSPHASHTYDAVVEIKSSKRREECRMIESSRRQSVHQTEDGAETYKERRGSDGARRKSSAAKEDARERKRRLGSVREGKREVCVHRD